MTVGLGMRVVLTAVLAGMAVNLPAQTGEPAEAPAPDAPGYVELDIAERRITAGPYEVSKALVLSPADGKLRVHVGATLSAGYIDVLLRHVKGRYRFRANLDALRHTDPSAQEQPGGTR